MVVLIAYRSAGSELTAPVLGRFENSTIEIATSTLTTIAAIRRYLFLSAVFFFALEPCRR
jgi:hypothetical protein